MAQSKILREVPPANAFYFYTGMNEPTGVSANSLSDLLTKLKSIDLRSVEFHTSRGDLENWVRMLGDENLAHQLASLKRENLAGEALRARLIRTLESRTAQLNNPQSAGKQDNNRKRSAQSAGPRAPS